MNQKRRESVIRLIYCDRNLYTLITFTDNEINSSSHGKSSLPAVMYFDRLDITFNGVLCGVAKHNASYSSIL